MGWVERIRRRFAALHLGAKLAWLSAGLSALFVAATLIPLSISTRQTTRSVIADELRVTRTLLIESQSQQLSRLEYAATLIGQNSTIIAAIAENETQSLSASHRGGLDPELVATARDALKKELPNVRKDLIAITDDSGRVFAAALRDTAPIVTGTNLSAMQAVKVALNPAVRADTVAYGVIDLADRTYSVAAVPLVNAGRTLGAVLLGERIDSTYLASIQRAFGTDSTDGTVVVATSDRIIASTDQSLTVADLKLLNPGSAGSDQAMVRIGGREVVAAPLSLGENRDGAPVTLWLLQPVSQLSATLTRPIVIQFILYGFVAVLLSGLGAAIVAQSVLRPLNRFIGYMRGVTPTAEPTRRFELEDASPEIKTLDNSFSTLMESLSAERGALERRTDELAKANVVLREEINERQRVEQALSESEAQLRQSQKLEAIGTLAGGVAHDFNNLLTVITGYTQLAMMRMAPNDTMRDDLKQVVEASDRAARLTHQLLAFSRKQVLQPTVIDLNAVVEGVAPMLQRLIGEHIEFRFEHAATLSRIIADRSQLEQVIINLVVNARDAMPKGGTITIRTANTHVRNDPRVLLAVSDTGTGIPPEVRERIFEPFYTTKEQGKGTGLGLSMVYGIVKQTGGTIEVDSTVGMGTTFTIYLPRGTDPVSSDAAPSEPEPAMARGHETILIVEDEGEVRALAHRTLEALGYTVLASADVDDAVRLGMIHRIDLILSDIVMPGLSGPQVVARLASTGVRPIIVYMSGYADDELAGHELDEDAVFLRKPFSPNLLATTIRSALDRASASTRTS